MRKPISKIELLDLTDKKLTVKLIDIRSADEYEKLHVPGAVNIPTEQLENSMQSFSKDDVIVCVCNHGKERSQKAAELLYNSGFTGTHYLTGGTGAWYEENMNTPVISTATKPAYTLKQLVLYFLKLGYSGFGGP